MVSPLTNGLNLIQKQFASFSFLRILSMFTLQVLILRCAKEPHNVTGDAWRCLKCVNGHLFPSWCRSFWEKTSSEIGSFLLGRGVLRALGPYYCIYWYSYYEGLSEWQTCSCEKGPSHSWQWSGSDDTRWAWPAYLETIKASTWRQHLELWHSSTVHSPLTLYFLL